MKDEGSTPPEIAARFVDLIPSGAPAPAQDEPPSEGGETAKA